MTLTRAFAAPTLTVAPPAAGGLFTELWGLAVPWNTPTLIAPDIFEEWAPGAFRDSLAIESALPLHRYHDDMGPGPISDPIGVAVEWSDRPDGLHSRWSIDETPEAQDAAGRVKRSMLRFMSIRFNPDPAGNVVTVRRDGTTLIRRIKARLVSVSLVSTPAFATARVGGVRSVDPLEVVAAADAVFDLAVKLGQPLIVDAITGTPQEQTAAAGLVCSAVERFGAAAASGELAQIAEGLSRVPGREQLAVNVERARQLIDPDAMAPGLRSAHLDYWRKACGLPADGTPPLAGPAPRRRPRRR
ncbi:HK97 family phage prohead protease [Micromonospora sp. 4G57]|uniref:HK97 family phage prohead protease n=1 Tax=Micromonospora sicca TaxID=2202420 RepID=A0ABU5JCJ6_9ACTN|nr:MULTISPECIES: HK97 family phage prohead protease [unclassified Micromonospora]MDZ5441751.1 HK97 family phage prohead protease [Micromonospora sp. 4G57]MDZ5490312.1 HK97 family phage prohead protease [Micromonospora sp. 4G53]